MTSFGLVSGMVLGGLVLLQGFLLLGALRAIALLRWRLDQLEATTPSRVGRGGLRPGKKAPDFTLPTVSVGEAALHQYANQKLLLVFMQPGCGPCHRIVPELNRLHQAGDVRVLVIHNGDIATVERWTKEHRPDFPVALQERHTLSKRYEVFATPFAFLIDGRGVILAHGIVSTRQYLGFVLARAGHYEKDGDRGVDVSGASPPVSADASETARCHSEEVNHV